MQLLVSVRSLEEANLVGGAGVDLIDLKEPHYGSLGATSSEIWQAVVSQWHKRSPVSLALGELSGVCSVDKVPQETHSVKIGLAHCGRTPGWQDKLSAVIEQLPGKVHRVAVHYADAHLAESPSLDDVLNMALQLDCQTFLVDTFDKSAGSVFNHLSTTQLEKLRERLHCEGRQFALAGSLLAHHLPSVVQIQPDIVAVRGAVCHRERTGEIDIKLLRSFREQLRVAFQHKTRKVLSRG
ncbi:(5-formylfuran-3-yl)methyl phosphate synthase [Bremerella alba]|uniref:(5-formylfuran-3-yl)methyl phosphate synthase n=1 Tax=Bremerella alba TaxID=980252 RepID=A0A7V8V4Q7_9BACT|nr:(5-formylfuran-3-yl)methyl phosphate synthase [Bremerella alba]MBA2114914.1 hypothetical protein [Bremerella alba]